MTAAATTTQVVAPEDAAVKAQDPLDTWHSLLAENTKKMKAAESGLDALPPHARLVMMPIMPFMTPKLSYGSWAAEAFTTEFIQLTGQRYVLRAGAKVYAPLLQAFEGGGSGC